MVLQSFGNFDNTHVLFFFKAFISSSTVAFQFCASSLAYASAKSFGCSKKFARFANFLTTTKSSNLLESFHSLVGL
jgi:hypothetical protein